MSPKFKETLPYIGLGIIIFFSLIAMGSSIINVNPNTQTAGIWDWVISQKYSCNEITGKCERDTQGISFSACQQNCTKINNPTKYICKTDTGKCEKNSNGQFTSQQDCLTNCHQTTRYTCDPYDWQCDLSASGEFSSYQTCESACQQPTRATCLNTGVCFLSDHGFFPSLSHCLSVCKKSTTTSFSCNPFDFTCYPKTDGTFPSIEHCENACKPPATCQKEANYCFRCSNNKPGYEAHWTNCGPCDYNGGVFDPIIYENGKDNIFYELEPKCGSTNNIMCGSPEVGGICVNNQSYCGKVIADTNCSDANLICCHKDYTYIKYPCSRCSNNYGCATATWNNKVANCNDYQPIDGKAGEASYTTVNKETCGEITGGNNSRCTGTTPPSTETCASKGGTCKDTWLCSNGSWGYLDCVGSTKTCCKSGSTPPPPAETCASKGGSCKDYRLCNSQTLLGIFNCTGMNYCCK